MVWRPLLLLLLASAVASATIDHYRADLEVGPSGTVRSTLTLVVNASPGSPVALFLTPSSDLRGPPGIEVVSGGVRFPAPARGGSPIEIAFITRDSTSKTGGLWNLSFGVGSDHAVQRGRLRVVFPPGATLQGFEPAATISARERLQLEWPVDRVPASTSRLFTARYLLEETGAPLPLLQLAAVFAASAAGGFLASRLAFRRRRSPVPPPPAQARATPIEPTPRQKDLLATLTPREQEVMGALLRAGGQTTQADLRTETGLPKSTLSRTLAGLQRRQLVEMRDIGHTNLVLLSPLFTGAQPQT